MAASRLITGLGIFVALSGPALANMPPKEFDHPYAGKVVEHMVAYGKANKKCDAVAARRGETRSGFATYGCAFTAVRGKCEIVVSYDPSGQDRKMLSNTRRHEIGHCNGWPSDHPNALP